MEQLDNRWIVEPSPIGRGAMASVFKGFDGANEMAIVAVKRFHGVRSEDKILQKSFQNELKAFGDLLHPNVVRFLDWGDDDDSHPYLVLEWVPSDLTAYLKAHPVEGWDDFAPMALGILRGLAHVHERGHVHRDIKPANILVTDDGTPKLADFGISRLRDSVIYDQITFMGGGTEPYLPPKTLSDGRTADPEEPMTYRFDRDVYAFAVLVTQVLAFRTLLDRADVEVALNEIDPPPAVFEVIRGALSLRSSDRPQTAGDALRRLEAIQAERQRHWLPQIVVPVRLTKVAVEKVAILSGMSEAGAEAFILEDLNGEVALTTLTAGDKARPGQYRTEDISVAAVAYKYRLRQDTEDHSVWVVIGAVKNSTLVDSDRDRGYRDNLLFKPHTECPSRSGEDADQFFDRVAEHVQDYQAHEQADVARQLFAQWSSVLHAKRTFEERRGKSIRFRDGRVQGRRVWLRVGPGAGEDLVGQPRVIRLGDRRSVRGEVEQVSEGLVALYVEAGSLADVPEAGELQYDTDAAKAALGRQEAALNAVRHGRSVRADLGELIARPQLARPPRIIEDVMFLNEDLDESKREAIRAALGLEDMIVVEGPPGTGKTTFIAELVAQFHARNPGARTLLSSQTHAALDNALERLHSLSPHLRLVRLGRAERVSEEVDHLRLDPQLESWRDEVLNTSRAFLARKAAEWGISASQAEVSSMVTSIREATRQIAEIRSRIKRGQDERRVASQQLERLNALAPGILDVAQRLESLLRGQGASSLEEGVRTFLDKGVELAAELEEGGGAAAAVVEHDERLRSLNTYLKRVVEDERQLYVELAELLGRPTDDDGDVEDLLEAASHYAVDDERLARLDELHQDWQRQFGRGGDFDAAFVASADVVAATCVGGGFGAANELEYDLCIIDEVSKANPTEALIPMSRSRRWVLVGDRKQLPPFQEAALADEAVRRESGLLREDLSETLLDRVADHLPLECRFSLLEQHRMAPEIGDLVSECFYDGRLSSAPKDVPEYVVRALGKPVVWVNTSGSRNRRELQAKGSTSFSNELEADEIRTLMTNLAMYSQGTPLSVAVLTGYADQRDLVRKVLHAAAGSFDMIDYEVATVDAFQGREADVCILSLVRSNDHGQLGFLTFRQRINVAVSRGRTGLAVVGDAVFVEASKSVANPLSDVLRYMRSHPETCVIAEVQE
jgi:tRNA A-37 threonylcarbamoyl transferase component Bud32